MSWDYRIVKYKSGDGFGLHEIFYDDNGVSWGMSEEPVVFKCYDDEAPQTDIADALLTALVAVRQRPIFKEPDVWEGISRFDDENGVCNGKEATDN